MYLLFSSQMCCVFNRPIVVSIGILVPKREGDGLLFYRGCHRLHHLLESGCGRESQESWLLFPRLLRSQKRIRCEAENTCRQGENLVFLKLSLSVALMRWFAFQDLMVFCSSKAWFHEHTSATESASYSISWIFGTQETMFIYPSLQK